MDQWQVWYDHKEGILMHCFIALMWSTVLQQRLHESICSPQSILLLKVKHTVCLGLCTDVGAILGNVIIANVTNKAHIECRVLHEAPQWCENDLTLADMYFYVITWESRKTFFLLLFYRVCSKLNSNRWKYADIHHRQQGSRWTRSTVARNTFVTLVIAYCRAKHDIWLDYCRQKKRSTITISIPQEHSQAIHGKFLVYYGVLKWAKCALIAYRHLHACVSTDMPTQVCK